MSKEKVQKDKQLSTKTYT